MLSSQTVHVSLLRVYFNKDQSINQSSINEWMNESINQYIIQQLEECMLIGACSRIPR